MENNNPAKPKTFYGVTVSSTFTDLKEHRAALISILHSQGLHAVAMENDSALAGVDLIDSSLKMVRDGSAYIGIISKKYGQTPICKDKNAGELSITELEFIEARKQDRPVLLFIMGKNHLVHEDDVELDPVKREKLKAFKENAKKMENGLDRIYAEFNSLEDFKTKAAASVAQLNKYLDDNRPANNTDKSISVPVPPLIKTIPAPPKLYAEPPYIGSHIFVGRQAELNRISEWAKPADGYPVLLFDAIGGNGKSMLTWHWVNNNAPVLQTWAGIFWYSFYERGAQMSDFCRHALAYITRRQVDDFKKIKTPALTELLIPYLKDRPWLFILDGLERVLVAYNRIDAAQLRDEELNTPTDEIVNRDPCVCINHEDDELLKMLSTAAPSKILISSRLVPKALLNNAGQAIPGVRRIPLDGLQPDDAVAFFEQNGVSGNKDTIRSYLITNCDCHPLTVGILAGLVNNYLPAKGDFDKWVSDSNAGGSLNLAKLDLVQKRNHILKAAMRDLSAESRQLLSTLALLSESVDYATISAFNPHLRGEPVEIPEPENPEFDWYWKNMAKTEKQKHKKTYQEEIKKRKQYLSDIAEWHKSSKYLSAPQELEKTVHDLQERGLLQDDKNARRYDLHPVVRGIASGGLKDEEKQKYGQQVVDFFSAKPHNPYEEATTWEDVSTGVNLVRAFLKIGRHKEAFNTISGDLFNALYFNLEAYKAFLAIAKPFFPSGWLAKPTGLDEDDASRLINFVAICLSSIGGSQDALVLHELNVLRTIEKENTRKLVGDIFNWVNMSSDHTLSKSKRIRDLNLRLAKLMDDQDDIFRAILDCFVTNVSMGEWNEAEELWQKMDSMGRNWWRGIYRPGDAEYHYAVFMFRKNSLQEEHLAYSEKLAREGKNRTVIRWLYMLRGDWELGKGKWQLATDNYSQALRMAREVSIPDISCETWLALAKLKLGELKDAENEIERLVKAGGDDRGLAELYLSTGNKAEAEKYALAEYKWAWAEGEPYVYRYYLNKAIDLLNRLGVPVPVLPPYDPTKDVKSPWEEKVEQLIAKLKKDKEEEEKEKA